MELGSHLQELSIGFKRKTKSLSTWIADKTWLNARILEH
jgi:hypothetical protein